MGLVHIDKPVRSDSLPYLSDAFTLRLDDDAWAALLPRHHLMWVSPKFDRVRDFTKAVKHGSLGYAAYLSDAMKQSFEKYYISPLENSNQANLFPNGQVMDSSICFLPTNDCNLGCKYCFSGAQPNKFGSIPWEIAKAAIDLGTRNAIMTRMRTGVGGLGIRFFGGGEPTEYWERFAAIVEYARASAQKHNLQILVATITNGQIDQKHYHWFRKNIDEVSISMDGPPEIQNAQRPVSSGEDSFDKSWKFVSAMAVLGMNITTIRVTVTEQTVNRMAEIAEYFWDNLPNPYPLQFEPVYFSEVGRQSVGMPGALDFVENFRHVEELARRRAQMGKRSGIAATATRPLTVRAGAYCDSLEGRGMFVTPNGYLSLCSEVSLHSDPRKDNYFVGGYDFATKRFQVSEEGASKVRCGPPWWCRGCYAQFSCRGGCEPRSQNPAKHIRKWWCQMVRANLKHTWSDVRANLLPCRCRIGDTRGEELIWLPIWEISPSMDS
jgi:radical SAM protein with 4Fe4S-binding SPASM domain